MDIAYHGTSNPDIHFIFPEKYNGVAYFSDSIEVAKFFATMGHAGGLLPGETPTIIHAEISIENPLIITEEEWEDIADSCNIDKMELIRRGYDGIICTNESNCTYFVITNYKQINIIKREII